MDVDALQQLLDLARVMQRDVERIISRAEEPKPDDDTVIDWPAGTVLRWTHKHGPEGKPTRVTAVRRTGYADSWKLIGHPSLEYAPAWSWNELVALWASNTTTVLPPGIEVATDWGSFKKLKESKS